MTEEGARYHMHLRQGELGYLTGVVDVLMYLCDAHRTMSSEQLAQSIGNILETIEKTFPNTKEEALQLLKEHFN